MFPNQQRWRCPREEVESEEQGIVEQESKLEEMIEEHMQEIELIIQEEELAEQENLFSANEMIAEESKETSVSWYMLNAKTIALFLFIFFLFILAYAIHDFEKRFKSRLEKKK